MCVRVCIEGRDVVLLKNPRCHIEVKIFSLTNPTGERSDTVQSQGEPVS